MRLSLPLRDRSGMRPDSSPAAVPRFSIVTTIYNDGYLAAGLCEELNRVLSTYLLKDDIAPDVEVLFVNDGSTNDSLDQLKALVRRFRFVRVIDLSRNFGQHVAILCGYREARGQFVARLNVDMQDPPSELPLLLDAIQNEDVDLVVGVQKIRHGRWLDVVTARFFFWFFNLLTGATIPRNTATLRVMNRRFADAFKQVNDKFPFVQGLENWFGFRVKYVPTEHRPRSDDKSSYTLLKRLKLAIDASIAFSDRPLRFTVYLGLFFSILGFSGLVVVTVLRLVTPDIPAGYSSIMAVLLFFAGIQIFVIGLCGLYIGKILAQVQDRPAYLIRERINFD
jgi:glycosyltransferase involved in cell wall biosynthesis